MWTVKFLYGGATYTQGFTSEQEAELFARRLLDRKGVQTRVDPEGEDGALDMKPSQNWKKMQALQFSYMEERAELDRASRRGCRRDKRLDSD